MFYYVFNLLYLCVSSFLFTKTFNIFINKMLRFLKPLEDGDPTLEVDLSAACQAKEESWSPRDNACNFHWISVHTMDI